MDDVVIAMTAWRRPGYLRRALESWSQTRGIEETGGIVISADPSDKTADIIAVADAARARGGGGAEPRLPPCQGRSDRRTESNQELLRAKSP